MHLFFRSLNIFPIFSSFRANAIEQVVARSLEGEKLMGWFRRYVVPLGEAMKGQSSRSRNEKLMSFLKFW
jgi:hypothetical protein